jgi:hypothetical protein
MVATKSKVQLKIPMKLFNPFFFGLLGNENFLLHTKDDIVA